MTGRDVAITLSGATAALAADFLAFTLTHRAELGIPATHPRVLVEAALAVGGTALALALIGR